MKNRFTTFDIAYLIHELRQKLVGLRVDQIYDIDKKTYLIRLVKSGGVKRVLLLDSGTRFHTTQFDWPKNPAPSGFSVKLRKHLNNKRLEKIEQVGADRIVHLQFGMDAAAYHLFLELYDKGNIILTDHTMTILNLVRPRIIGEERMAAHEKYALDKAKQHFAINSGEIEDILRGSPTGTLRENFLSKIEFGPALFSNVLASVGLTPQTKIGTLIDSEEKLKSTLEKLTEAFNKGTEILTRIQTIDGIIVLAKPTGKKGETPLPTVASSEPQPLFYDEFHPSVLAESFGSGVLKYDSFDECVDEFFSKVESQKIDMKQLNQEKDAIKKLEKVKLDQHKRLKELQEGQEVDKEKAELITINQSTVDMAISTIRKLVANQIPWDTIEDQLKEARLLGDPLATMIVKLNLKQNKITLKLSNLYDEDQAPLNIDVDLNLSAFANASKYFDLKKASAKKEERTMESQGKAFKSTEKKTMATLKEAAAIHSIKKARKVLWFEKFKWFITSENYLVIGGRDAQQNELLVKRYLRPRDVYMHADAHGAPTLIIKNDIQDEDIPPKSLNECGVFAVSSSGSWENKIVPSSWWVYGDQVSKSAPTGEYLPTGSFMIRGKKNYLPPYQLVLGFGLLFRMTGDSIEAHKNERARKLGTDNPSLQGQRNQPTEVENEIEEDIPEDEEFPDTHVNLNIDGGKLSTRFSAGDAEDESEFLVTSVLTSSINTSVQKMKNKQKKNAKLAKNQPKEIKSEKSSVAASVESLASPINRPKRGQHGRKKKLKEKYKFQDDEERELRMKLLSAGQTAINEFEPPSSSQTKSEVSEDDENPHNLESEEDCDPEVEEKGTKDGESTTGSNKVSESHEDSEQIAEGEKNVVPEEEPEEEESKEGETELDLLKTLTGSPLEQDELLFAIPVVAPYSTLQNYKYRIKMVPGTTKRGKAAKTALESFLREKEATSREKDLIKAVKDQDFSRNFPGKVKLSNVIRDKK